MANRLYEKGRQAFADAGINWTADDIRCVLVDLADYSPDFNVDEFLSAIPAPARVATLGASLGGKSNINGTCDASDAAFGAVTGDVSEAVVIYKHTGSDATARLIAYIDTAGNLPVTPNGTAVTVEWDNGTNKIFRL
jgi:hypothetical protein